MVALALLDASSAPFDRAFAAAARRRTSSPLFDPAAVSDAQLVGAGSPGVAAAAGPFGRRSRSSSARVCASAPPGPLTVVGRADPGGPVDRLDLWQGRWAAGPGEIVLNETGCRTRVGSGPDRAR